VSPKVSESFTQVAVSLRDGVRLGPLGALAPSGSIVPTADGDYEYGAVDGMRTGKRNQSAHKNQPKCHIVHHKFCVTLRWIEPSLPWLEPSN
jgi:hypothetical protein